MSTTKEKLAEIKGALPIFQNASVSEKGLKILKFNILPKGKDADQIPVVAFGNQATILENAITAKSEHKELKEETGKKLAPKTPTHVTLQGKWNEQDSGDKNFIANKIIFHKYLVSEFEVSKIEEKTTSKGAAYKNIFGTDLQTGKPTNLYVWDKNPNLNADWLKPKAKLAYNGQDSVATWIDKEHKLQERTNVNVTNIAPDMKVLLDVIKEQKAEFAAKKEATKETSKQADKATKAPTTPKDKAKAEKVAKSEEKGAKKQTAKESKEVKAKPKKKGKSM